MMLSSSVVFAVGFVFWSEQESAEAGRQTLSALPELLKGLA
jgi:hypothetical protein